MTHPDIFKIADNRKKSEKNYTEKIHVCYAAGCLSARSDAVKESIIKAIENKKGVYLVKEVGCLGLCAKGPLVSFQSKGEIYHTVTPENAKEIIDNLNTDKLKHRKFSSEFPFLRRQKKIVLENMGIIDPEDIEDYIRHGGYKALDKVLYTMTPSGVIREVIKSNLRGRGGAGYPTGLKWTTVSKAGGAKKFIICNADEGDPGAFMDRSILEGDPHKVIEGIIIAGFAVGATQGYIYIRSEYPLAAHRLEIALKQARKYGLLGKEILHSTFSFDINLRMGAGAFVCGEETGLIASVEGRRGTPRPRPPYPAQEGLWRYSTLINNVETFANISPIILNGGEWYASIGTESSKGTKVFALAGRINNTGLIEVPMGITLREIVYDIGGGIPDGKKFKAIQTGGPSGGCIPEQFLDMTVDYESLKEVGAIMGSGGMIIIDETSCMVDVARFFLEFCMSESCGKCISCRVGTAQMYHILMKICLGRGTNSDLKQLEELCDYITNSSLCGLGQTAPNPVRSTLRYFKDEYNAHIMEKKCPAGVCEIKKEMENTE
ncbi:MAG: NAD(P)H-dependent oxidoreductase subunit E [Candidatus Heimdallarchaeota archaeon]|nr:MAG: NAD(P)H-dependent oxidoreductase subunit E [Candidatus Heimdallarchaeota archaeon]